MSKLLEVRDLRVAYGKVEALHRVSLEVAEGVALPIYEQVRAQITPRIAVGAEAPR